MDNILQIIKNFSSSNRSLCSGYMFANIQFISKAFMKCRELTVSERIQRNIANLMCPDDWTHCPTWNALTLISRWLIQKWKKSNKRNKIDNLYNKATCISFLQSWPYVVVQTGVFLSWLYWVKHIQICKP